MTISRILDSLFSEIHATGSNYVLVSGFDEDVLERGRLELDLFVPAWELAGFSDIASRHGFFRRKEPPNAPNHIFFVHADPDRFVTLDVRSDLDFHDFRGFVWRPTFSEEDVLRARVLHSSWYRARGKHALALNLAHRLLKQSRGLSASGLESLARYARLLAPELSAEERDEWRGLTSLPAGEFPPNVESRLQEILRHHFSRHRSGAVRRHSLRKTVAGFGAGVSVLFLGTDGSGKGTLIELVSERLEFKNRRAYFGTGQEGWISRLARKAYDLSRKKRPGHRFVSSLFWYAILPGEFLLRRMAASIGGRWRILLLDRFPGKPFLRGGLLSQLYKHLLPRPDLVVLLGGDAAVIAQRKPSETDIARTEADIRKWEKVARKIDAPVLHVDTAIASPPECAERILAHLLPLARERLLVLPGGKRA